MEQGKVMYDSVTDEEAMEAFVWLSRSEGIVPAFESAHAIAYLKKIPRQIIEGKTIIVSLSGRGDKDMIQAMQLLNL
jgi:tryptophan synthase beta chain